MVLLVRRMVLVSFRFGAQGRPIRLTAR